MLSTTSLEDFSHQAEAVFESAVAAGSTPAAAMVGVFKDEKSYLWAVPDMSAHRGRPADSLLSVLFPIIIGMEPDFILLAQDVCVISRRMEDLEAEGLVQEIDGEKVVVKRSDGKPWGPGEMQHAMVHNTIDAQDVSDCLFVSYFDRLGQYGVYSRPYQVVDGKLSWAGEPTVHTNHDDGVMHGYLPEHIQEFFRRPTVRQDMIAQAEVEADLAEATWMAKFVMAGEPGMSAQEALDYANERPEEAYAHMICAVIKYALIPQHCQVMLPIYDEDLAEVFRHSLSSLPGVNTEWVDNRGADDATE